MTKPNKPSFFRKIIRFSVFISVQLLILLILLEIVGRIFDITGISYYPETARYLETMIKEEPIGYRNRPNLEGNYYGADVKINSIGLRDEEISLGPDKKEFRILVVGDSFPFGVAVNNDESLPAQLGKLLKENIGNIQGRKLRSINMGVLSYNTDQELIQFKTLGIKLQPDLVVLLFSYNDIESKMWVFDKREKWYVQFSQQSYALSLIFKLYGEIQRNLRGNKSVVSFTHYTDGNPRWESIKESLIEMNAMCKSAGIPFVLVTRNMQGITEWDMLNSVASKEGFPLIDLQPRKDERFNKKDKHEYIAKAGGTHPNVEGNLMWATVLFDGLVNLGLLPADTDSLNEMVE